MNKTRLFAFFDERMLSPEMPAQKYTKSSKKPISLIEVMIAIALILLAASSLGWKMYGMIAKKRFSSSAERLRSRLLTCRRLAVNTQSDWQGNLFFEGKEARFSSDCSEDRKVSRLPTLSLGALEVLLDGQESKKISFDFTSSGEIHPHGKLQLRSDSLEPIEWNLSDLFSMQEGTKAGPAHPKDWN